MKKENQPGNYQLKADLEGNYLIDKEHIRNILCTFGRQRS